MLSKKNLIESLVVKYPYHRGYWKLQKDGDRSITYFFKVKTQCFPYKSLSFRLLKSVFFGVFPLWSECEITFRVGCDIKIGIHLAVAILGEFV